MRIAGLAIFAAAAVFGFGAGHLALTVTAPQTPVAAPALALAPDRLPEDPAQTGAAAPWPAAFGRFVPAPAPAPTPEPEAAPPPAPLFATGYSLTGFVASGDDRWAIVEGGFGEILVRVGDRLTEDSIVVAIDEQGVWIDTPAGRELIGFE